VPTARTAAGACRRARAGVRHPVAERPTPLTHDHPAVHCARHARERSTVSACPGGRRDERRLGRARGAPAPSWRPASAERATVPSLPPRCSGGHTPASRRAAGRRCWRCRTLKLVAVPRVTRGRLSKHSPGTNAPELGKTCCSPERARLCRRNPMGSTPENGNAAVSVSGRVPERVGAHVARESD